MNKVLVERWPQIRKDLLEFGGHFAESVIHQDASKRDISMTAALNMMNNIYRALDTALNEAEQQASSIKSGLRNNVLKA